MPQFAERIIEWQRRAGRHDLPWQRGRDAYRIWLSEIMLQQTQVAAVVPYFERFAARFPDVASLARAAEDAVLQMWSGLGYYARARNLHRAARLIMERHGGRFPHRFEDIAALPGVGRSTAGAIAVFAFGQRHPILDGNVKRVFARYFGIDGYPGEAAVARQLWARAQAALPQANVDAYIQGLMDLGATVCTRARPRCADCPLAPECVAHREARVDSVPAPRPRRVLPQRAVRMLVLRRAPEVLLERRPASGVWGALWCFPELAEALDADETAWERFGARIGRWRMLPPVNHAFTHFRLEIRALLGDVTTVEPRAQSPGFVWLSVDRALGAAIPSPVRAILRRIAESASAGEQLR
ncbi:MAG TPA: A/G-specific adenine glycosylase [Burkholderiales bacterium]|jgi:A/G-specific adenine glycosylase|nr:A/G-specific adenine glycosylase [Burkholderiales bacterium]